jgi:hypothetical protein
LSHGRKLASNGVRGDHSRFPPAGLDFDGLLGFRTLGFRKVWLDFENGLFGWE